MSCDNFTSVNGTLPSRHPYTIKTSAPLTIMVAVLILLIVFGNVLVVMAVTTSRALRAPQNLFLVSLACADILVATLVMPFSLANELMGYWYFGQIWCEIYLALDVLFCTSSIVHLCAISMDRYWSISQAIEYNAKRTPCRIKCIVFIVWMLAAMISFPPLITMEKEAGKEHGPRCEINKQKWYIIFSSTASYFAPCVIMILVYVRIYQIAKKRTRGPPGARRKDNGSSDDRQPESAPRDGNNGEGGQLKVDGGGGVKEIVLEGECSSSDGNEHSQCSCTQWRAVRKSKTTHVNPDEVQVGRRRTRQNRDKRFTFVLAVVMGAFVICWCPFFFTYTLKAMCDSCCVPETLFKMFFWFGYCNSSLNPVIYTVFNKDFQRAFKKIIC